MYCYNIIIVVIVEFISDTTVHIIHCEPKNTKMFLSYLPQNAVDSDKRLYTHCPE